MVFSAKTLALFGLLGVSQAAYKLTDTFDKSNFFDEFEFFDKEDPTKGYVKYVNKETADSLGIAGFADGEVFLGVDNKNPGDGGRQSTRVSSKKTYDSGLFISDITHMPIGCGVWPALWTTSEAGWPTKGEIDIIEGVNMQKQNAVTLHTNPTCMMTNKGSQYEGKKDLKNPDCSAPGGKGQEGCGQQTDDSGNYGAGLNAQKGGIYAMEWTKERIAVWFFPRGSPEEQKLSSGSDAPDVSSWGLPMANFNNEQCSIEEHFKEHKIIINTTLCGEWAGNVFASDSECSSLGSCNDYVAKNPDKFTDAFWQIKSIKVYQNA